jgi:SAM-dependent methyltransferase
MFDRLRPWVGTRVLEIGSGIGNLSALLVESEPQRLVLTDTREEYLETLRHRFAAHPHVSIERLYLPNEHGALAGQRFDTIICLNVLEHVDDDSGSLAAIRGMLAPRGRLVLLVPALPALFGSMDRALGHHRRYGRRALAGVLQRTGYTVSHIEYFNLAGVPGWWFVGRVLRRPMIPTASLQLYDALVPLFRLERLLPWRIGQSLIAIGEAA